MIIRQADLAREFGVSSMTIHRALKPFGRNGHRLTEADALLLFTLSELQTIGFSWNVAAELMAEFPDEHRFVAGDSARRCWITFVEQDDVSFRLASLNERHLMSVLDALPMVAVTLPLHRVVAGAQRRLAALKTRKEAA